MKILVCCVSSFFAEATERQTVIGENLCRALVDLGHKAEFLVIPFSRAAPPLSQYLAVRLVDLAGYDKVIGLGYPSHVLRHSDVAVWFTDPYDPAFSEDPDASLRQSDRIHVDRVALKRVQRIYFAPIGSESTTASVGENVDCRPWCELGDDARMLEIPAIQSMADKTVWAGIAEGLLR